jgi:hypothetical protein
LKGFGAVVEEISKVGRGYGLGGMDRVLAGMGGSSDGTGISFDGIVLLLGGRLIRFALILLKTSREKQLLPQVDTVVPSFLKYIRTLVQSNAEKKME